MSTPADVLVALQKKQPDATIREAELFCHLWGAWPYIPRNLTNMETFRTVHEIINDWIKETYGLRFTEPRKSKPPDLPRNLRKATRKKDSLT